MDESFDYDNMTGLVKKAGGKKFMFMRNSWGFGNYGIINKLILKSPDDKFGTAIGFIKYADGNKQSGAVGCSGCYSWRIIKVFEEDVEVQIAGEKKKFQDICLEKKELED